MAAYGPNTSLATKLVVSVLDRPGERKPSSMRTWTTEGVDVRRDPTIGAEVSHFLRQHGVKETVTSERIIGCPHQEGIDYPWAGSVLGALPGPVSIASHTNL
jgi:hypothetical protein